MNYYEKMIRERKEAKARKEAEKALSIITEIGGKVKLHKGKMGVWFDGPESHPQNSLFIPLSDFGYSKAAGIFRKSLAPHKKSIINL